MEVALVALSVSAPSSVTCRLHSSRLYCSLGGEHFEVCPPCLNERPHRRAQELPPGSGRHPAAFARSYHDRCIARSVPVGQVIDASQIAPPPEGTPPVSPPHPQSLRCTCAVPAVCARRSPVKANVSESLPLPGHRVGPPLRWLPLGRQDESSGGQAESGYLSFAASTRRPHRPPVAPHDMSAGRRSRP